MNIVCVEISLHAQFVAIMVSIFCILHVICTMQINQTYRMIVNDVHYFLNVYNSMYSLTAGSHSLYCYLLHCLHVL